MSGLREIDLQTLLQDGLLPKQTTTNSSTTWPNAKEENLEYEHLQRTNLQTILQNGLTPALKEHMRGLREIDLQTLLQDGLLPKQKLQTLLQPGLTPRKKT